MVKKRATVFRSRLAPAVLIALTQAGEHGMTLRDLARALSTTDSAVQRALSPLLLAAHVRALGSRGPRYVRISDHSVAEELLRLAASELSASEVCGLLVRASADVELASLHEHRLSVIYGEGTDPRARIRLRDTLRQLVPTVVFDEMSHREAQERLTPDTELRTDIRHGRILKGRAERALPDRQRHGDFRRSRRLGKPHPTLAHLSRRTLQRIARDHALTRLALFGSAVRADFRPDSDVDVLVRRRATAPISLMDKAALQRDLERALDRDVDVVEESELEPGMRPVVEREEVVLYGRP